MLGQDVSVLDTVGSGSFIGVTASFAGDALRSYLEGDERIYVDDDDTPAFYGTGTEDFFNGGFYFDHGPYTQPLSGNPAHLAGGGVDRTSAYRFFLQDAVPFRRRIRVSLQHGGPTRPLPRSGRWPTTTSSPQRRCSSPTPSMSPPPAARAATATGSPPLPGPAPGTYQYEGAADTVDLTDNGRAHRGTSQFTLAISPLNSGVLLRRRFDQTIANQRADLVVDGQPVGPWYVAGNNPFDQWRDTDFLIPPTATAGKTAITVTLRFVSSSLDWNEFTYWAYTLTR